MFVILVYDVESKRVPKILKICRKYLTHVQNSVFEGYITNANYEELKQELLSKCKLDYDSIIVYCFDSLKYSKVEKFGKSKNKDRLFL